MPPKRKVLALSSIGRGQPGLTTEVAAALVQAAAVCLDHNGHKPGVRLDVDASVPSTYTLDFPPPTKKAKLAHDDHQDATEDGAVAIAIAVVTRIAKHRILGRARKKTGFDWWLGPKAGVFAARLEVSGILSGRARTGGRVRQKLNQMKPTDATGLPGYAAVIEFSEPRATIVEKP